jgi:hypothetical protein
VAAASVAAAAAADLVTLRLFVARAAATAVAACIVTSPQFDH